METTAKPPFLVISLSTGESDRRVPLIADSIFLGRKANEVYGDNGIDLNLDIVSQFHHAQIMQDGPGYIIKNYGGRHRIRIFEKRLEIGDTEELHHGVVFQIPDPDKFPIGTPFYSILFLRDADLTANMPFYINEMTAEVYIFGKEIKLTPIEYQIVRYLHENSPNLCLRNNIIATAWSDVKLETARDLGMDELLNVNLVNIRKKVREASGGFTFLETIRGRGIRMLV